MEDGTDLKGFSTDKSINRMSCNITSFLVKYDYEIAKIFKTVKENKSKLHKDNNKSRKTFEHLAYQELLNECAAKL